MHNQGGSIADDAGGRAFDEIRGFPANVRAVEPSPSPSRPATAPAFALVVHVGVPGSPPPTFLAAPATVELCPSAPRPAPAPTSSCPGGAAWVAASAQVRPEAPGVGWERVGGRSCSLCRDAIDRWSRRWRWWCSLGCRTVDCWPGWDESH